MKTVKNRAGYLRYLGVVGCAISALYGCGGGSSNNGGGGGASGLPAPGTTPFTNSTLGSRDVCQANPHVAGRARWTVLVYLNAASNLQPFSLLNVAQMASIGSNADLNIVVQWKQTATTRFFTGVSVQTTPSFIGTRRYKISKHSAADINKIAPPNITSNLSIVGDTTPLDVDRLPDPPTNTLTDAGNPTADMGDYHTLADFAQWGVANFPADHVALVIWDHGSGALSVDNRAAGAKRSAHNVKRGLSQDVFTGHQIATQELPLALAGLPKFDALVVDCSLQGTTEVAYEVRNLARVYIGSEESPPGAGYPYNTWLNFLKNSSANPCTSGQTLINATIALYPAETNVTQSMIDLTKMGAVASALNTLGGLLNSNAISGAAWIKQARQNSQYFEFFEYKDLYHFANNVRKTSAAPFDVTQAAADLQKALAGADGAILLSSHGSAVDVANGLGETNASGLSIFLPGPLTQSSVNNTVGFDPQWNQLGIAAAAPNWATFLQNEQQ